jgi:hypothetical protein
MLGNQLKKPMGEGRTMKLVGFSAASIAGIILAFPASALTISNVDPEAHTIIVTAGTDTKELTVEPDQQVDAVCAEGCLVELENGEQYQMQGAETVSIEDGVIFVDSAPGNDADDVPDMDDSDDNFGDDAASSAAGSESTGATPPAETAAPADAPADAQ